MFKRLRDLLIPFASIAWELRLMNELKELELNERLHPVTGDPSPIIRRTEKPRKSDTEISYMGVPEKPKSAFQKLREDLEEDDDDGDDPLGGF